MKTSMNDEPDFYLSRGEIGRLLYGLESYHNEQQRVIASERKAKQYRPGVAAAAGADAQELRERFMRYAVQQGWFQGFKPEVVK